MTADKKFKRLVRERARRTGESYAAARHALLGKRSEPPMGDAVPPQAQDLVEVRAAGIRTDAASETPFLVLEDPKTGRRLLIAIGPSEATAIAFAQQQVAVKRPMTHDALKQTVDALGARLLRVVVDHQPETSTFTADVVLTVHNGDELHLDWRVSDSVALAVRCDPTPPILVPERLLADPPGSSAAGSPPWLGGVRVRCSCSAWIPVPEDVLQEAAASEAELVEADVECPSCGQRRHVRLERPPARERVLIVDSAIDPAGDP
jgi:bifunctional DNase/RNase